MAWATKKQFAILNNSKEGKNILENIGRMSQEQFNTAFNKLIGGSGVTRGTQEQKDNVERSNKETSSQNKKLSLQEYLTPKKLKELFELAFEVLGLDFNKKQQGKLQQARDFVILQVMKKFDINKADSDYKFVLDTVNNYYQQYILKQ